jgi:hypothetical protein
VYLFDVEGFTAREIADIMQTPVGTVLSRLHRGHRRLRSLLEGYAQEHRLVPAGHVRGSGPHHGLVSEVTRDGGGRRDACRGQRCSKSAWNTR